MKILLTGVTGAIGSALAPRLLADGHEVRGLTRDPDAARASGRVPGEVELVGGDISSGRRLRRALKDVDVAYFLIHSMEPSASDSFEAVELTGATHFARAAEASGLRRAIYLGGIAPPDGSVSAHMASRLRVEQVVPCSRPRLSGSASGPRS